MAKSKVLTDSGRHTGGYIVHEQDMSYSREVGTLRAGQGVLEAGTVLYKDGNRLMAMKDGQAVDTRGHFTSAIVGVLYDTYDTGLDHDPAKDLPGAVYTARATTVNLGELVFPAETTAGAELQATIDGLKAIGIVPRLGHTDKTDLG